MSNIFIRHGEVENPKDIYYVDVPGYKLSNKGKKQAEETGEYLRSHNLNYEIISSPLLRARQTAEIISKVISVNINFDDSLYEWMGPISWRGLRFDEIDLSSIPKVAEEYTDVFKRVSKIDNQHEKKIFVSHQDTIRSFTYFAIADEKEDFTNDKPSHCEVQQIDKKKNKIVKLFKPS
tara:strand:+ start:1198 stop:1731 length:534 start_codon:yes stop_codon:yes gene_type:complete